MHGSFLVDSARWEDGTGFRISSEIQMDADERHVCIQIRAADRTGGAVMINKSNIFFFFLNSRLNILCAAPYEMISINLARILSKTDNDRPVLNENYTLVI